MTLFTQTLSISLLLIVPMLALAQHDHHETHGSHSALDHPEAHMHHPAQEQPEQTDAEGPAEMTTTAEIEAALADGGKPVVAEVLGVVCDFCATAMNKIFGAREEVAAVYVDLDTKALNLVLRPEYDLDDLTIEMLAVQAGYRIAAIHRNPAIAAR